MTPEQYEKVASLLEQAAELPIDRRDAFLDDACGGDEELRGEVASLLDAHERTGPFAADAPAVPPNAFTISAAVQPGGRVGPYEILSLIGAGGMGEVFRARDPRLGRDVALKILPAALAGDSARLRRFAQEARAVGRLNHPNVLAIYDVGAVDGIPYFVSELLDGKTLRELLADGPMPLRKAVNCAVQVARGLAAAHERGIVHRDLKPENLFVTKDGQVKILDFGLAKLAAPRGPAGGDMVGPSSTLTQAGVVMGTTSYMSPEQARGESVDHRSDLFSFGSILYEIVAGEKAFHRASAVETMHAILREEPPPMSDASEAVPEALEAIVVHCLEKEPEARFQSARDVCFALESLADVPSRSRPRRAAAGPRWWRRRWAAALGAVLLAAVLIAVATLVGSRVKSTELAPAANVTPSFRRLTYRRGQVLGARFAPDGQTIVYVANWGGLGAELFTQRVDSPEARSLGIADIRDLASVSSSGELAVDLWKGGLSRVSLSGGAPRALVEDATNADWSPDGKDLMIVRWVDGGMRIEYPIGQVIYRSQQRISDPRVSPRGDLVAFFEGRLDGTPASLAVVDKAGNKTTLTPEWAYPLGLAWSPNGDEVWFTATSGNDPDLVLRAADLSGHVRVLASPPTGILLQDVSRDGRVLLNRHDARLTMMVLLPGETKERDLSWFAASEPQALSNDGKALLFTEIGKGSTSGGGALYLRGTDGSPAVRLAEGYAKALSPDGKWAASLRKETPPHLVLVPTGAGQPRDLETGPITFFTTVKWFPDGTKILINGGEPDHPARCYVQQIAGGPPTLFLPDGLQAELISPDGQSLIVKNTRSGEWTRYRIATGVSEALPGLPADEGLLTWSADGRSLFTADHATLPLNTFRFDLNTKRRTPWKTIAPEDKTGAYYFVTSLQMTPDGRSYAYSYWRVLSDLYLAEGLQ